MKTHFEGHRKKKSRQDEKKSPRDQKNFKKPQKRLIYQCFFAASFVTFDDTYGLF
jgi:hypothetical protein